MSDQVEDWFDRNAKREREKIASDTALVEMQAKCFEAEARVWRAKAENSTADQPATLARIEAEKITRLAEIEANKLASLAKIEAEKIHQANASTAKEAQDASSLLVRETSASAALKAREASIRAWHTTIRIGLFILGSFCYSC